MLFSFRRPAYQGLAIVTSQTTEVFRKLAADLRQCPPTDELQRSIFAAAFDAWDRESQPPLIGCHVTLIHAIEDSTDQIVSSKAHGWLTICDQISEKFPKQVPFDPSGVHTSEELRPDDRKWKVAHVLEWLAERLKEHNQEQERQRRLNSQLSYLITYKPPANINSAPEILKRTRQFVCALSNLDEELSQSSLDKFAAHNLALAYAFMRDISEVTSDLAHPLRGNLIRLYQGGPPSLGDKYVNSFVLYAWDLTRQIEIIVESSVDQQQRDSLLSIGSHEDVCHLAEHLRPKIPDIRSRWAIPDVDTSELLRRIEWETNQVVKSVRPNGERTPKSDIPTEADRIVGKEILSGMSRNATVEAFRKECRRKELRGSNQKLSALYRELEVSDGESVRAVRGGTD
ncbi:hypothetical protein GC163_13170 [bacterium]|nr:hypothetical protein [bacterium]